MAIHQKVVMSQINKKVHWIHPQLCSAQGVSLGPNNDTAFAATRVGDRLFQIRCDVLAMRQTKALVTRGAEKKNSMWAQVEKRKSMEAWQAFWDGRRPGTVKKGVAGLFTMA